MLEIYLLPFSSSAPQLLHFAIVERQFQQPLCIAFVILQSSVTLPLNLFSKLKKPGSFKSLLRLLHPLCHFSFPSFYSFCNDTTSSFMSAGQNCTQYARCECMKILHNRKIMQSILSLKSFLMMAKLFGFWCWVFFYFFLASASNRANRFQRTVKTATTSPRALSWAATASYEYIKYYAQNVPT